MNGEQIELVDWSEDLAKYVKSALEPAKAKRVELVDADLKRYRAFVPDFQMSLAIGREGQNVRLAARLTHCKIDIVQDTEAVEADGSVTVQG